MWFNTLESPPLPNLMKEIHIEDLDLVITTINKQLYCFENRCPHEDIKLSLGCVQGNEIKCALHGYKFNLDSGLCVDDDIHPLKTFQAELKDGLVSIQIEEIDK